MPLLRSSPSRYVTGWLGAGARKPWPPLCETIPSMKITLIPHALEQMEKRGVSESEVRRTIEQPEPLREGRLYRIVAEKSFPGGRVVRVVYNRGRDEAVVVTVITKRRRSGGGL